MGEWILLVLQPVAGGARRHLAACQPAASALSKPSHRDAAPPRHHLHHCPVDGYRRLASKPTNPKGAPTPTWSGSDGSAEAEEEKGAGCPEEAYGTSIQTVAIPRVGRLMLLSCLRPVDILGRGVYGSCIASLC